MTNVFTVQSSTDWQLPQKSCLINFSTLSELYCKAPFRSFSIKYVCSGKEKYIVNGNAYSVEDGQYLLANHFSEGYVEIDKTVKGICIDVAPDLLSEVVASYRRPDSPVSDLNLDIFFNSPDFFENKYDGSETNVGAMLRMLQVQMESGKPQKNLFDREFYIRLAEQIIKDHIPVYKQLHSIKSIKPSTKKFLLRKLIHGKEYIDSFFLNDLYVNDIAKKCGMSEYHFYRMFRSVFGKSPHQYVISKRLEYGSKILKENWLTITEASVLSGFSDVYSFSKSFKKYFGINPAELIGLRLTYPNY